MKTIRIPTANIVFLFACAFLATSLLMFWPGSSGAAEGGLPLWTNRYIGPAADSAIAIAVDLNGNVLVTGTSYATATSEFADVLTIKYSGTGVPLWTQRYRGPGNGSNAGTAIGIDSGGNIFVAANSLTGQLYTSSDYAVIAYSGAGVPLWTNRYDGPGNGEDFPIAVAVDRNGHVFVMGYSWNGINRDYATLAYSNAGVPLWTNRYAVANGSDSFGGMALDKDENVIVTGGGSGGFATVKYLNTGAPLWTNRYTGLPGNTSSATGVAVAPNGNVLVTGSVWNGSSYYDYATIAYSSSGVALWTNQYNGPAQANSYDVAHGIAVDTSGNVFVTGSSYADSSGQNTEYATIKYSITGVPLWTNRYTSGIPFALGVDDNGNVFVAGDHATIAYSNGGTPLWTNSYAISSRAFALDRNGNVFVAGSAVGSGGSDYVTIKYSSSVLPPHLDFQHLNNQLVLSWSNPGSSLQSGPTLTGRFTNMPGATSPSTNSLTAPQQFFRLGEN